MTRPATAIRLTAVAVGAAYSVALYLNGIHIQAGWKQALSYLPAALTVAVTFWDVWLWRQPIVHRLSGRPFLAGTWQVELQPTAESHIPSGGNRGPIEAYVIVFQSYWSISVRQYTNEGHSDSRAAIWTKGGSTSGHGLTYTYSNTPRYEFEHRSMAHRGTALIDVTGRKPAILSGYYFTDRYTKGDMHLKLFDRSADHPDFASVQAHCKSP
jgi:SMODS-associating 2TM, beta-strand rich effector domain